MNNHIDMKNLLCLIDMSREEMEYLFGRAQALKKRFKQGIPDKPLAGKTLGLIFDKASTRTRISFESAIIQLGGSAIFMKAGDTQISRNEPAKDTARVLSRFIDGLAMRTFSHSVVEEFAEASDIPIINALTDQYHPCQVLSDLMTVIEYKGGFEGVKIAWVGDGNNVSHSWINAAAVLGLDLTLACPEKFMPSAEVLDRARERNVGNIVVTNDPAEAVSGADVIYTDVWESMGQEHEGPTAQEIFMPYQVNGELVARAKSDVIVMHCLPAHRGEEITEEVLEGPSSVVWNQAENKLHMHKAILETLMCGSKQ